MHGQKSHSLRPLRPAKAFKAFCVPYGVDKWLLLNCSYFCAMKKELFEGYEISIVNYLAQKNNYAFLLKKERKKEAYYYKIFLISRY